MTLVIAAQFGARIVVFSDTMISNRSAGNDIIPGRLKSVILNGQLSICYSGNADLALDVIRRASSQYSGESSLEDVFDLLANHSFDCEFIVASHLPSARLSRIAQGRISTGATRYWIGNPRPIQRLAKLEASLPVPTGYIPNNIRSPEEDAFRRAMQNLLSDPVEHAKDGVGGFLVELLGSPHGHCYGGGAIAKWFDTVHFSTGLTMQQLADRASGMTAFGYTTLSSERGAAVLGIFIEQIGLGYIYRPMKKDFPEKFYPCSISQLSELVSKYARDVGGFFNE